MEEARLGAGDVMSVFNSVPLPCELPRLLTKEARGPPANARRTDRGLDTVLNLCGGNYTTDIPSQ